MAFRLIGLVPNAYRPLVPWALVVVILSAGLAGVQYAMLSPAQERLTAVEAERAAARTLLARHLEALQVRRDMTRVMATLPTSREFAGLPLAISDMAKRDRVALPSFSYTMEKAGEEHVTKAVLQGAVTGQYEDLRSFIHHLETSDRVVLFVEDLSVGRSTGVKGESAGRKITVTIRLATYIREQPRQHATLRASLR